jgi:hypothetical protein
MSKLRLVIRELIKEAAITPKQAGAEQLALYWSDNPQSGDWAMTDRVFILYSPKALMEELENGVPVTSLDYNNIVYGVIALDDHEGECNNASSVHNVAAQKGYGPLMYNIAGVTAPGGSIAASRDKGSVKPAARNVWNHYYSGGQVHVQPFDDPQNPRDDDPENDCKLHGDPPLDHSYSGMRAPFGGLLQAHQRFASNFKGDLNELIEKLGDNFYMNKYIGSF